MNETNISNNAWNNIKTPQIANLVCVVSGVLVILPMCAPCFCIFFSPPLYIPQLLLNSHLLLLKRFLVIYSFIFKVVLIETYSMLCILFHREISNSIECKQTKNVECDILFSEAVYKFSYVDSFVIRSLFVRFNS